MALTTLYNATNHPLTWDKVNEVLKVVDDNFTFVSSAVTTGDLSAVTQDIVPGSGNWDIGSASNPWDNVFANNLTVNGSFAAGTLQADVYGDVFGSNSSRLVDFANSKLTGDVDNWDHTKPIFVNFDINATAPQQRGTFWLYGSQNGFKYANSAGGHGPIPAGYTEIF